MRLQIGLHRHRHFGSPRRRRRAAVTGMVDQRPVGLVPHCRNQRNVRFSCSPHHSLVIEAPEILQAAATARHDDQVRPLDRTICLKCVETGDGARHFIAGCVALNPHRPDDHMDGKAVFNPVQDVANHGAGR